MSETVATDLKVMVDRSGSGTVVSVYRPLPDGHKFMLWSWPMYLDPTPSEPSEEVLAALQYRAHPEIGNCTHNPLVGMSTHDCPCCAARRVLRALAEKGGDHAQ